MSLIALAVVTVNIDAGVAALRLNDFGTQSGAQMLFNFEDMKGYKTNAVQGTMDMFVVLDRMIEGTPLKYQYVNHRTVTVTASVPAIRTATRMDNGLTAQLILDGCSFGLIPSEMASEQLGEVPGACWCCASYDDSIQDEGRQREAFCVSLPSQNACSAYHPPHQNIWSDAAISEVTISSSRASAGTTIGVAVVPVFRVDEPASQGDQPHDSADVGEPVVRQDGRVKTGKD